MIIRDIGELSRAASTDARLRMCKDTLALIVGDIADMDKDMTLKVMELVDNIDKVSKVVRSSIQKRLDRAVQFAD